MPAPSPENGYQVTATDAMTPGLFNSIFSSIGARLDAREAIEADFEQLIAQGTSAALTMIQVNVAPQLEQLQTDIEAASSAIEDILAGTAPDALRLGGELPAHYASVTYVEDAVDTLNVALVAALAGKLNKSGGALTGNLSIAHPSAETSFTLNSYASNVRVNLLWRQGDVTKHLQLVEATSGDFLHWVQNAGLNAYSINSATASMTFYKRAWFSEGLRHSSTYAASATDLSKHIAFYSTTYGISVTANSLNAVAPAGAEHNTYIGETKVQTIGAGGVLSGPAWSAWGGSTIATTAIDNKIAAVAVPAAAAIPKAWARMNGTGTAAIVASYGVTSITDNGTGSYTVNLASALPDTNFAVFVTAIGGATNNIPGGASSGAVTTPLTRTTSSVSFETRRTSTGSAEDHADINVLIFR